MLTSEVAVPFAFVFKIFKLQAVHIKSYQLLSSEYVCFIVCRLSARLHAKPTPLPKSESDYLVEFLLYIHVVLIFF